MLTLSSWRSTTTKTFAANISENAVNKYPIQHDDQLPSDLAWTASPPDFRLFSRVFRARMVAPMKVLHIVKTAVGASWAYEQARVLRSLGVDVAVALPSDTEGF